MELTPKIELVKYNWNTDGKISVTGFTWLNSEYISGETFRKLILNHSGSVKRIEKLATLLNGQFSFVVKKKSEIWLGCSHTWSYPLFYSQSKNEIIISDDPYVLLEHFKNSEIEHFSKNYFLLFGVTPNSNTLVKQIQQVNPGEIVVLKNGRTTNVSFFDVVGGTLDKKVGEEKLYQSVLSLFEKYYNYLKNKHVLLPLTRGYDSRLLACLLKEFGHKNVLCATWGRRGNTELVTAQKVANKLGYQHIFIEYNKDLISGFPTKDLFVNYAPYAGHLSSMPFLQDYFAINYLKENKFISSETVAIPGYSGDYFAGSHLDANIKTADNRYLLSKILNKFGSSYPINTKGLREIEKHIQEYFLEKEEFEPWQQFEQWDFQERQCKFISNANHAWFCFGVEVLMPLFDKEFIEFFKQVPLDQRLNAGFYNTTLENRFFRTHEVDFDFKSKIPAIDDKIRLKNMILKVAPRGIKKLYYPLNDPIFYREITSELIQTISRKNYRHPVKPHKYNSYIIQWYLDTLQL